MKKIAIPKKNLKVRNPKTKAILKPEGEMVEVNRYWLRRALDKDVILEEIKVPKKEKQPQQKTEK